MSRRAGRASCGRPDTQPLPKKTVDMVTAVPHHVICRSDPRQQETPMTPTLWRTGLFVFLAYGYHGTFDNVLPWLGIMLVAHGMDFVRQSVIRWDAEERRNGSVRRAGMGG